MVRPVSFVVAYLIDIDWIFTLLEQIFTDCE